MAHILDLEGGCNFRDLGGYRTGDGRRLRHGLLFRSGVLSYFNEQDLERLRDLGVRTICDFRRINERRDEPTRWPDDSTEILFWDDGPEQHEKGELSLYECQTPEAARETMASLYRSMPKWLEPRLRGMFDRIAEGNIPLVFHCAAGKDRTGLAAALLLHSVGVPREVIIEDYRLTNEAVDLEDFFNRHRFAGLGLNDPDHPLTSIPTAVRQMLVAALDQIEQEHGCLDSYLEDRLGLTSQRRARVQSVLLTD